MYTTIIKLAVVLSIRHRPGLAALARGLLEAPRRVVVALALEDASRKLFVVVVIVISMCNITVVVALALEDACLV